MLASHLALQLWRSRKKPAAVSALRVGARVLRQRQLSTARRRTAGALLCSRTNHQQQLAPAAPSFSGFSTHALGDKTADDDGNDPQHDYPNPLERVCVVGTGPAGFYFARYLLREHPTVQVDMIDALPNPYGLVRSGVAPDHPEVKSVENDFDTTARVDSAGRLTFLGNVMVGKDVQLDELRRMYNAVVLAYGAQSDRSMGIPGENLQNSLAARPFVNWYNGHPDYTGVDELQVQVHHPCLSRNCERFGRIFDGCCLRVAFGFRCSDCRHAFARHGRDRRPRKRRVGLRAYSLQGPRRARPHRYRGACIGGTTAVKDPPRCYGWSTRTCAGPEVPL